MKNDIKKIEYGDDLPITAFQINRIMQNCAYQIDTKNEWVQWATGDKNRTSLKSINQGEAVKIIKQQTGQTQTKIQNVNFGTFKFNNPKHKLIMSLVRQNQWTKQHARHGEVADMDGEFSTWLQSEKSPVRKPLMQMNDTELEKIIKALSGLVRSKYKR